MPAKEGAAGYRCMVILLADRAADLAAEGN